MSELNFNPAYVGTRKDIQRLVPSHAKKVLDVGCSVGALGAAIKSRNQAYVVGIELSEAMATQAKTLLDEVFIGDAAAIIQSNTLGKHQFDVIIFADVLEHLIDPWTTLQCAVKHLAPDGVIVTSIPNIRHISSLLRLIFKGDWPYFERGIHDKTHLRFFTYSTIDALMSQAGLKIEEVNINYRFFDEKNKLNKYAKYFAWPFLKHFIAFQYVVRAKQQSPVHTTDA